LLKGAAVTLPQVAQQGRLVATMEGPRVLEQAEGFVVEALTCPSADQRAAKESEWLEPLPVRWAAQPEALERMLEPMVLIGWRLPLVARAALLEGRCGGELLETERMVQREVWALANSNGAARVLWFPSHHFV
jgi:hypothetical protein